MIVLIAPRFVDAGYLWNRGNFMVRVFRAALIVDEPSFGGAITATVIENRTVEQRLEKLARRI